jgi:methyl coenzyme M reductase gamma subunit
MLIKKTFFFLLISTNYAYASDECSIYATAAVEMREDYKSYAEVVNDMRLQIINLQGIINPIEKINKEAEIEKKLILADDVFKNSFGYKGKKLYGWIYKSCDEGQRKQEQLIERKRLRQDKY